MRKSILISISSLLATVFLFSACQKKTIEPVIGESKTESSKDHNEGECRLVSIDWETIFNWQFHYNNKGVADQWIIDYGFGPPFHTNDMTYDQNGRLVRSIENFFGSIYEYRFYYSGDRLIRHTRINVDFPDDALDFQYTYNRKGEIIRQDDNLHDQHVLMYYDALGNCTKTDLYFGTDLFFSDNYTFNHPVKNPRKNIPGVKIGFPFYGTAGLTDKRWFTSNRTVLYDVDGTSFVFNDYDPSKTVIKTDNHNLPITADYYDMITGEDVSITFEYDNCGGINSDDNRINNRVTAPASNKPFAFNNIKIQLMRIFYGPAKNRKEQISELRKQLHK